MDAFSILPQVATVETLSKLLMLFAELPAFRQVPLPPSHGTFHPTSFLYQPFAKPSAASPPHTPRRGI